MTSQVFERFKKALEDQIDSIVESIAPLTQAFAISADDQMDDIDYANAKMQQFLALRLHERRSKFAEKVAEVKKSIYGGSFGICRDCGDPIESKRLEARPMTVFCFQCKSLLEREESRRKSRQGVRIGQLHLMDSFA